MKIKETSCGFLVISGGKILLAHATNGNTGIISLTDTRWGFPKGHVEPRENEADCAIRELFEEVGLDLRKYFNNKDIIIHLDNPFYTYINRGGRKQNKIFLVDDSTSIIKKELSFKCSTTVTDENYPEIDAIKWVTLEEAKTMVMFAIKPCFDLLS